MVFVWIILGILSAFCLCFFAAVIRTLCMGQKMAQYTPKSDRERSMAYGEKLSALIQCETISRVDDPQIEKFRGFHEILAGLFPKVHENCQKIEIDGNLMYRWAGKSEENPILLMSHMDVVEATGAWTYPPFSGTIADGKVWGRGTSDTKGSLMAFLQAAEELIGQGFVPACDVYLASSCTEEHGGTGAPKLAGWLKEHGVTLFMLLDEGGSIVDRAFAGIDGKVATLGLFEKGYGDVRFIARGAGGHSSSPPKNSPIPRLAAFVNHVEKHNPFRVRFSPEVNEMFRRLAPYYGFRQRLIYANLWLFRPLLGWLIPRYSPQNANMLQTTIAFTMQSGSKGRNVIPQEASVTANLRFIPHQGTDESLEVLRKLSEKFGLEMEVLSKGYPSGTVDIDGRAFALTEQAISACFPGVAATPFVVTAATDARFYKDVCDNCIRFSPMILGPEQLMGIHGLNENIGCDCLPGAVDFYKYIIKTQGKEILPIRKK